MKTVCCFENFSLENTAIEMVLKSIPMGIIVTDEQYKKFEFKPVIHIKNSSSLLAVWLFDIFVRMILLDFKAKFVNEENKMKYSKI